MSSHWNSKNAKKSKDDEDEESDSESSSSSSSSSLSDIGEEDSSDEEDEESISLKDEDEEDGIDEEEEREEEDAGDMVSLEESDIEEEREEDEEDDTAVTEQFKKFTKKIKQEVVEQYHPMLKPVPLEEIRVLTQIHHDVHGNIQDSHHRTSPFLTKYERARILADRESQLEKGARPYISFEEKRDLFDYKAIAKAELEQRKLPLIIARPLQNGSVEYWNLQDLELI